MPNKESCAGPVKLTRPGDIDAKRAFGIRLRMLRTMYGFTCGEMAGQIGALRDTYRNWELGRGTPDYNWLRRITRYFGVSADYFIGNRASLIPPEQVEKALTMMASNAKVGLQVWERNTARTLMYFFRAKAREKGFDAQIVDQNLRFLIRSEEVAGLAGSFRAGTESEVARKDGEAVGGRT